MKLLTLCFNAALLAGLVLSPVRAADDYAQFSPAMPAGTAYALDAGQLHPTQFCTGQREIDHKRAKFDQMTRAEVTAYLIKKDVPLVIGPGGVPCLTDGHHTINALLACTHPDKTVYGHILANWSDLTPADFWRRMRTERYTYLRDATGRERDPADLPATLAAMTPDPYRGLAWALMQAGAFTEIKPPAIFFQEFYWADFLRDRITWDDTDEADFARAVREATALAHSPAAAALPGYIAAP